MGYSLDADMEDARILEIRSPRTGSPRVTGGPFVVVAKETEATDYGWAIVALEWHHSPRLGIRWFYKWYGHPHHAGNRTWFIIPPLLAKPILQGLEEKGELLVSRDKVLQFLCGEKDGDTLG